MNNDDLFSKYLNERMDTRQVGFSEFIGARMGTKHPSRPFLHELSQYAAMYPVWTIPGTMKYYGDGRDLCQKKLYTACEL